MKQADRQGFALLVGVVLMLMWGTSFTVMKQVFEAMSVGGYLFARYLLLAPCAICVLCCIQGWHWRRLSFGEWRDLVRAGLIGQFAQVALVIHGIDLSTAFSSSLLVACGPVFTLLILHLLGFERLRGGQVLGVAVACGGVVIFSWEKLARADWAASLGDLMLLGGTLLFSVYTVLAKPLMARHGAIPFVCLTTLVGVPPMLVLGSTAAWSVDWGLVAPSIWLGFAWTVLVVAFFGWMIWGWVNGVRGVARSAPLLYLMPPVAGLVAWLASGETFSAPKLVGAAIALSGVALAQLQSWGDEVATEGSRT